MSTLKPIVLLVHGMGSHRAKTDTITDKNKNDPNITDDFVAGLNEAALRFNFKNYDAANNIAIHEFNYSNHLEAIRQKMADSMGDFDSGKTPKAISRLLKSGKKGPDIAKKIIGFHNDLKGDDMLFTHWLDVYLYGATHWGEDIRVRLVEKINELFRDTFPKDIHIIGHSLGTSVVHDTLWKLYSDKFSKKDKVNHQDIQLSAMKVKSVWSFANVSNMVNILNGIGAPNEDVVSPGIDGCCMASYNIHNQFDPFTWYRPYRPKQIGAYFDTEATDVRIGNTHDFKEYVSVPEVARQLMMQIDPTILRIKDSTLKAARAKYDKTTLNGKVQDLQDNLKKFKKSAKKSDIESVFKTYKELKDHIKKIKEGL